MLCCVVAGLLIARFMVKWPDWKKYLGFKQEVENEFGWREYCELDDYES